VAQALTATRLGHPEYRLRIIEGSNSALHDQVRAGELNLAIVGAVQTLSCPELGSMPIEMVACVWAAIYRLARRRLSMRSSISRV
ncbi:hypothetical protein AB9F35_34890, partial [Rhizobium leguminosarum]|uniref:hypothetical protein n=1 Tax=Rhizobium leguminosarum TaxID=384 RepID=UPI003F974033